MNKEKRSALCRSLLWGICILCFPILSGTLSAVFSLGTVEALFLQGVFMVLSLLPPLLLILTGKWSRAAIGLGEFDAGGCRRALYFLPMLAILIPPAVRGFSAVSAAYVWGNAFLYLAVGFSEEVYFRGIIPGCLHSAFSQKEVVFLSTVIFGVGHIASAFTAGSGLEVLLSVLNALIFGWLSMEMVVLCRHIFPTALLHFLFDFETKITAVCGGELWLAECCRGAVMVAAAVWLAVVLTRMKKW